MKATMNPQNTDGIQVALTLTMSLSEWREFKNTIDKKWPGWKVAPAIGDMINKFEARLDPDRDLMEYP